jgi:AhpC/TSA family
MRRFGRAAALAVVTLAPGLALRAQAVPAAAPPVVGDTAPDFTLPGATAAGPAGPLRLSDFRGKTVVLAFFFQARTKG